MKHFEETMKTYVQKRVHELENSSLTASEIYDIIMEERPEEPYADVLFGRVVGNVLSLKPRGS